MDIIIGMDGHGPSDEERESIKLQQIRHLIDLPGTDARRTIIKEEIDDLIDLKNRRIEHYKRMFMDLATGVK